MVNTSNEEREILALLQVAADTVLAETAPRLRPELIFSDSDIDSLDLVEMFIVVEEHENRVIVTDSKSDFTTVQDVISLILEGRQKAMV